jgi:hypothetical protein
MPDKNDDILHSMTSADYAFSVHVANAVLRYYGNVRAERWAEEMEEALDELYPERDNWAAPYRMQRMIEFSKGFDAHWWSLDDVNQVIHMQLILRRSGLKS